ncbi:GbsR/MarR family transcriptional regulator [Deinococcus radiopugnans]|uniref:GbsR/MarR family transcriptional regulator n=1 Tax=Deinococcus radiopugnans TaxID=57497 RepID=UPI0036241452
MTDTPPAPDPFAPTAASEQFMERAGLLFEMVGMPRAAGRVLGALLVAPAGGLTPAELAERLQASRAGISGAVKHLTLLGLAERAPNPGERADRFRVRPNAWATLTEQGNRKLQTLHDLAADGLQALPPGAEAAPCARCSASTVTGCACSPPCWRTGTGSTRRTG